MMSTLSLALTGEQAVRLADEKRRELAAQWGRPSVPRSDRRRGRRLASRALPWLRRRPAAC